jgi:hypothetical protein
MAAIRFSPQGSIGRTIGTTACGLKSDDGTDVGISVRFT